MDYIIVLINDEKKYIIFTYPKSGCSVTRLLHLYLSAKDSTKVREADHHNIKYFLNKKTLDMLNSPKYSDYYRVLVYRNPYERILSSFLQKICGIASSLSVKDNLKQPRRLTRNINSFERFIDNFETVQQADSLHQSPQKKPAMKIDKYVQLEDIESIFDDYHEEIKNKVKDIFAKTNINFANKLDKTHINPNVDMSTYDFLTDSQNFIKKSQIPEYKYFLTEEMRSKIRQKVKDDFYDLYEEKNKPGKANDKST